MTFCFHQPCLSFEMVLEKVSPKPLESVLLRNKTGVIWRLCFLSSQRNPQKTEKLRPPLKCPSLHVLTRSCWSCPEAAEPTSPAPRVCPSLGPGWGRGRVTHFEQRDSVSHLLSCGTQKPHPLPCPRKPSLVRRLCLSLFGKARNEMCDFAHKSFRNVFIIYEVSNSL